MTKKYIVVTFHNGSRWVIEPEQIACNSAEHYASNAHYKGTKAYDKVFEEEKKIILSSDDDLIDWAENNMNWKDFKDPIQIRKPDIVDYNDIWPEADTEVEELDIEKKE